MGGGALLADSIEKSTSVRIAHHVVHSILEENGLARTERGKSGQCRTERYVKRYPGTVWHTDYKLLPDGGKWLTSYQDDASRKVLAWGAFERTAAANAITVLDVAIAEHGVPLSVLSDHVPAFCDNESWGRGRGEGRLEKYLREKGIRNIKACVSRPRTNDKLERVHGEIERKMHLFSEASAAERPASWAQGRRPGAHGRPVPRGAGHRPRRQVLRVVQQRAAQHGP